MHLEIRYSPACHPVWGKLTGAEVGDTVETRTSPTRGQIATVITGRTKYTPMLPVPQAFTAQATAVAVNPKKHEAPHGHVMAVGADAAIVPSATTTPTEIRTPAEAGG
ncbi:hypothetical protein GCM10022206_17080 [Streptomyces chiangmaiensis]